MSKKTRYDIVFTNPNGFSQYVPVIYEPLFFHHNGRDEQVRSIQNSP